MKFVNNGVFGSKLINYLILINFLLIFPLLPVSLKISEGSKNLVNSKADWTLMVFVQANNSLKNFAQTNFAAMGAIGSSPDLNILVQCYFPQNDGVYRYKVEKNKMVLDSHIQEETDGTTSKDLVESFRWAVTKYPAKKYALILWNHGIGILDPVWGKINHWQSPQKFYIQEEMLAINPRIHINDLTVDSAITNTDQMLQIGDTAFTEEEIALLEKAIDSDCGVTEVLRGILFNEQSRTYMTNQAFTEALRQIKKTVLNGKKIDLLGMDACLMAMVEVGYQSREFADYLVASEESELAHGWDYESLCKMLSEKADPKMVACGIVANYELFYKNKINFYTLSAIDLSLMNEVKTCIDGVMRSLQECKNTDKAAIISSIKKARTTCQQFSAANYIDLHSFFVDFLNQINPLIASRTKQDIKPLTDLKIRLQKSISLLEQTIVANTSGKLLAKARGLSIYFPLHNIDRSYLQTEFCKNSDWTTMITELLPAVS
ncbi:MAG: Clostripain family protease [candidate division TM6 bacterium GW2011_GWF2_37_49]|nr:MAG: Clostripain family protease [candidate division TM6 bacterium GW2011_GWF2_37_49]